MTTVEKYRLSIRHAIRLSLPIITGQLGLVLMGFFDTVQVGGLGPAYIGACGVSNSVYFLFVLLGMGVLYAASPLVSEAFGEKHPWKSIGVMRSGVIVAIVLSVLFYCLMAFVIRHFSLFRENEKVTGLSQQFLHILNYSTPMLMFYTLGKQFMDGMGRTKVSMVITLIGLVVNVSLNWVLIYGKFGFPAMGIEGAALATGTARTLMCIIIAVYILQDRRVKLLVKEFQASISRHKSYVLQILKIGIPSGLQIFFEVGAFAAGTIMSGWLGETSLASHQISLNLASITFMMVSGIAAAATIMTGYAYGAKDKESIRIAGNTAYILTLCTQLVFVLMFLTLNHQLPKLYTSDKTVISISSYLLLLAALFQLSDGFQVVGVGILRGMQDVRLPSFFAFASYWLVMVPLSYFLAFNRGMNVYGIWIGFVIGLSIAAVLMYLRFRAKLKSIEFVEL